ncbi:MAG: FxsA family protein [Candidatus Devosia symbiotica]|nr:FxsA family protein [Candidatus Devosia symbiotica]
MARRRLLWLLRSHSLRIIGQLCNNISSGKFPGRAIADEIMISLGALLLIMLGFLSDLAGMALLLPVVQRHLCRLGQPADRG